MNIYFFIILISLLFNYALDIVSDSLNLKALRPELPEEFKGVYDSSAYEKSQAYTKVSTRFGFVTSTFDLAVMLLFWFAGGFNQMDLWVRSWELSQVWTGLSYLTVLLFLKTVLSLPFSIYSTFVIEEKFGFNRTKPLTFFLDLMKGLALSIVIGGLILTIVLALFEFAGSKAWLYCWLVVTIFIFIIQFVAPTWIMPLFNKFTPLDDGDLKEKIMGYAKSVKFSLENIFVIDGSRRSSKSNAFFTGFGKNKRIALFDTLIENHSSGELLAILAHEIGHYKKKHIIQGMVLSILHMGVMFYLLSIFLSHQGLFDAFFMEQTSIYGGLIFFGLLLSPIEMILSIFLHLLSRHNEYEADRFAAQTTGSPADMVEALKKLSKNNLSNLTPHPLHVFLNYSHPPVLERIHAINRYKND